MTRSKDTARQTIWKRFGTWVAVGVVIYIGVGAVVLAHAPLLLLRNWLPAGTSEDHSKLLGTAAQIVLIGLGGIIAVVGVGLSLSRHRQEIAASDRDHTRLERDAERELRSRFVTAVTMLSDEAPVTRQAGLFALGALADDWDAFGRRDEVRVCIEVITSYLRAPWPEGFDWTPKEEIAVKQAGYELIHSHLVSHVHSWSGERIRLDGAHIDFVVTFSDAALIGDGSVTFKDAVFSDEGRVTWNAAKLSDTAQVSLEGARIMNKASFYLGAATLSNQASIVLNSIDVGGSGHIDLSSVSIVDEGSIVMQYSTIHEQARVSISHSQLGKASSISVYRSRIRNSGSIDFGNCQVGGNARFRMISFQGNGNISLIATSAVDDGEIVLDGATIGADGAVSLGDGARVSYEGPIILPDMSSLIPPPQPSSL